MQAETEKSQQLSLDLQAKTQEADTLKKFEEDLKGLEAQRDNEYLPRIEQLTKEKEEAKCALEAREQEIAANQRELEHRLAESERERGNIQMKLETTRIDYENLEQARDEIRVSD